jgi:hypothetical protein
MKISQLKQLIKEAVQERIRMIDEAGDIAAIEAKINKVEEDIQDAMRVKSALLDMAGLKYYVEPEIISDMMDDMEASIKELQDKKKEFEEAKKQMTKPAKGAKKDKKAEDKPEELNENIKPTADIIQKTYNEMMGKNPSTTTKNVADKLGLTEPEIAMAMLSAGYGQMEETNNLGEKLKPSMGAGAYVDDFKKSKAPQFKGKSKAKKQDMAIAAYLGAKQK